MSLCRGSEEADNRLGEKPTFEGGLGTDRGSGALCGPGRVSVLGSFFTSAGVRRGDDRGEALWLPVREVCCEELLPVLLGLFEMRTLISGDALPGDVS